MTYPDRSRPLRGSAAGVRSDCSPVPVGAAAAGRGRHAARSILRWAVLGTGLLLSGCSIVTAGERSQASASVLPSGASSAATLAHARATEGRANPSDEEVEGFPTTASEGADAREQVQTRWSRADQRADARGDAQNPRSRVAELTDARAAQTPWSREQLWAAWNHAQGDSYELDVLPRFVEAGTKKLTCSREDLVSYRGTAVPYWGPVLVREPFLGRLVRFEEVLAELATETYGRAPRRIRHLGACMTSAFA